MQLDEQTKMWVEHCRKMTGPEKAQMGMTMADLAWTLFKARLHLLFPHWSDGQIERVARHTWLREGGVADEMIEEMEGQHFD